MEKKKESRRQFFSKFTKGMSALAIGGLAATSCQKSNDNDKNPWEYDLSALKKVDPKWLTYHELAPVTVQLKELNALTLDEGNNLYVAGDSVIQKFNEEHIKVDEFSIGESVKALSFIENKLYIGLVDHVEVWSTAGKKMESWEPLDRRAIITSIVATSNSVYIADAGNRQVLLFKLDGGFIRGIDPESPRFVIPSPYFDLAKDFSGNVWVVNPGKHQIGRINENRSLSNFWGKPSWQVQGFSGCCNPTHMTILPNGNFVTSEKGLPRVKVYDPEGELVAVVAEPKQFHESVTGLDLAVDKQGRVYVLDPQKKQVRIFVYKGN